MLTSHWITVSKWKEYYTQACSNGKHGMQHSGCNVRQLNQKVGLQCSLPDDVWRNLIAQQPESNSYVRKLLLLIYKSGIYGWRKNITILFFREFWAISMTWWWYLNKKKKKKKGRMCSWIVFIMILWKMYKVFRLYIFLTKVDACIFFDQSGCMYACMHFSLP